LRPVHRDGAIYVADYKGEISAVDAATGKRLWHFKTDLPFSGGPGVSEALALVGTQDGEVHAFLRDTGTPAWIARVSSEVLAAPVESEGIVVVRCIDGRAFGLDARNGRRIWVYDRSVPLLTLRGNSVPLVRAGTVYMGYDGGELVALRLDDGSLQWEQDVATDEGRTELDRLADLDGQMVYVASDLLVSSFKNRMASMAADSGRLLWFKDISSASGVAVDRTNMALTDTTSHVWLMDRRNGSALWKQDQLENRGVTRPAIYGNFVVAGDFEGYLHWMNLDDGNFAARVKAGGKGLTDGPLVIGDMLVVYTNKGELIAYRAGAAL
jgi:outer membrane protein assembly factor BamB